MKFKAYLKTTLGETQAAAVEKAMQTGTPIMIVGPQGPTGKTTLCKTLREHGAVAFEQHEVCRVEVKSAIKETKPNFTL